MDFPGLIANLTTFTYLITGKPNYYPNPNQADEDLAVTTFLSENCPNLQHLWVRLSTPPVLSYFSPSMYSRFTSIIFAKPNLKTPKTFVGLDLRYIENANRQSFCQDVVGQELAGWERVGLGQYQSFVDRH